MKKLLVILSCFVTIAVYGQQYYPQALIELYSSEGCENCPMADKFAREILQIADSMKQPVYLLDYHVDLWDRSGWKDPYSSAAYTARQAHAAKIVGQQAMFTPMIFVNGQGGVPGAAKREVGFYINNALKEPRVHKLSTSAQLYEGNTGLSIEYEIEGPLDSLEICFAFIQKQVFNKVTAGDNNGKTLEHHNLVRKLASETVKGKKGHYELKLPEDAKDLKEYGLVTFLQRRSGTNIFAVDELFFR